MAPIFHHSDSPGHLISTNTQLLSRTISTNANNFTLVSEARISKDVDSAMDKAASKTSYAPPGVSIRNGPVLDDKMDVDEPTTNGNTKRKARNSTGRPVNYNDDSEESDAVPLVRGF